MARVLAVDLGASSVRVVEVDLDNRPLRPRVVMRHTHHAIHDSYGSLRWDWGGIVEAVRTGLDRALERGPAASIGIDAWGIDYGLVDRSDQLVAPPFSYRDARTRHWRDVAARLGGDRLYGRTGIQLMGMNTIFQLAAHPRDELERADALLMVPELLVHDLTGSRCGERTSASTTGLVDLATGSWAPDLIDAVGVDPGLFPPLLPATQPVGAWRGVPVHLVCGHDSASAAVALGTVPDPDAGSGANPGRAYISSGSWMIVGTERAEPLVTDAAREANCSNEAGAFGRVSLLKNVPGLWIVDQLRASWSDPPMADVLRAASQLPRAPIIDLDDERLAAPENMDAAVRAAADLTATSERPAVLRCVLESIAASVATVLDELEAVTGSQFAETVMGGGATRLPFLVELLEHHSGRVVSLGPTEATAVGNALVQGVALGVFSDLAEAREACAAAITRGPSTPEQRAQG